MPTKSTQSESYPRHATRHLSAPDGFAVLETMQDGRRWFYPVWFVRQASGYLAPAYFPRAKFGRRDCPLRRFSRRLMAVHFLIEAQTSHMKAQVET